MEHHEESKNKPASDETNELVGSRQDSRLQTVAAPRLYPSGNARGDKRGMSAKVSSNILNNTTKESG